MNKDSIKKLNINQLEDYLKDLNQPKFRSSQILEWLYSKAVTDFSQMTNLPKNLITSLSDSFVITQPTCLNSVLSTDGTKKYVLVFNTEGENSTIYVECVAIPSLKEGSNKLTVCVSSQAGCAMGCSFCATGKQGFTRNLFMSEILEQLYFIENDLNRDITNVVVMGQGEPFNNFDNLSDALNLMNDERFFNIGARKLTVSTCGILGGIKKFADLNKQYVLAISLHSAIQETRNKIMPGVKSYDLKKLKDALIEYQNLTQRRITFEYILLDNINNSKEHLNALIEFCRNIKCHINIIKFNKIPNSDFYSPEEKKVNTFATNLIKSGIETTVRDSRGSDISAACGQLLNSLNK